MHVAIIMDGNGRWAESRGMHRINGHKEGAKRVEEIVRHAPTLGITNLTLYAFSTENWQRPSLEIQTLFQLIKLYLRKKVYILKLENVKINFIGRRNQLPKSVVAEMHNSEAATQNCTGLQLNIAVDYGGRDEILRAVNQFMCEKITASSQIDETTLKKYSDLKDQPDPDLIIRTGGDKRLSNFMLWHAAYSELNFVDTLWPDFSLLELNSALENFSARDRRFGAVPQVAE
jgi:undecaprenyl diphosphate synthase